MERINQILQASVFIRALAALGRRAWALWRASLLCRALSAPGRAFSAMVRRGRRWWDARGRAIFQSSAVCRALLAAARWCGRQWQESRIMCAFLTPSPTDEAVSRGSVFTRLWERFHRLLCLIYDKLHLERAADGSIFRQLWLLCVLPVALAPLLPTMAAAALCAAAWAALILELAGSRTRELVYSPMNKFLLLYAAVYVVCTLRSVDMRSSLPVGMLTVFFTLFAIVVQNAVRSRRQLERTVRLMVLIGAVVALYGMYQYVFQSGYQSQAWVDSGMFGDVFRVASTMQNPNMLGQYLVLIIPLGGACLLTDQDRKRRRLWGACCAVMCVCMLLTFSRGAWLGLLFAGVLFFTIFKPRLLLAAPFVLAALALLLPDSVLIRLTSIGDMADTSTSYRVSIWISTLYMLRDYWMCGLGPGTEAFNMVYPSYDIGAASAQHSHNLFLQITCDGGICALILFLLILFRYFKDVSCAIFREKDGEHRLFLAAFLAGVFGFLVQSMTDYSFYNYRVLLLFWCFLGLGAAAARLSRTEGNVE